MIGGAFEFDGHNHYLYTGNSSTTLQLSDDYTLSLWMKASDSQNGSARILCKTDSSGIINHWVLQFDASATQLVVYHGTNEWSTGIGLSEIAGYWHHVTVVRSGDTMRSYLDGVEVKSDSFSHAPGAGYGRLFIGVDRPGGACQYKGLLDDVRVYNRALTEEEVSALPDDASLIGHWAFDGSGSQVNIVASPTKAAIAAWYSGTWTHWSPAAGAFFKRIDRE